MWLMAAWLEDKGEEEHGRGHLAAGWVRLRQASNRLAWQSEALRSSGEAERGRPQRLLVSHPVVVAAVPGWNMCMYECSRSVSTSNIHVSV